MRLGLEPMSTRTGIAVIPSALKPERVNAKRKRPESRGKDPERISVSLSLSRQAGRMKEKIPSAKGQKECRNDDPYQIDGMQGASFLFAWTCTLHTIY